MNNEVIMISRKDILTIVIPIGLLLTFYVVLYFTFFATPAYRNEFTVVNKSEESVKNVEVYFTNATSTVTEGIPETLETIEQGWSIQFFDFDTLARGEKKSDDYDELIPFNEDVFVLYEISDSLKMVMYDGGYLRENSEYNKVSIVIE